MDTARQRGLLARFVANEAGASAIEFGLVAVPLIFLVMAIIEFGLLLFTQIGLESALGNVARSNTIGNTGGFPDRVSYVKAELQRQTQALIYGENIIISSDVVNTAPAGYVQPELCFSSPPRLGPTCPLGLAFEDSNGNGLYDGGTLGNDFGVGGDLVEINVALPWQFFTPVIGRFFRSENTVGESMLDGTYVIRASAVVKNEPF